MTPTISIVIPVHNGASCLGACLRAIRDLRPPPFECIVVDDGSVDGSARIAESAGFSVVSTADRRGPAAARNLGARVARGEILLFIDADVVVPHGTVARIAARFAEDPARDAVIGSYDSEPASPNLISQYRNLLHSYTHQRGNVRTCTFWTGCGAIRRQVFWAYGGFDEAHTRPCIEDLELGARLWQAGRQIWLDKGLQVKHLKRFGLFVVAKTDFADRAIPWTLLILRSGRMPTDLNLKWGQRFSVLAAGWMALAFLALVMGRIGSGGRLEEPLALSALIATLTVVVLNRDFYRFLADVRSPWFALRAFPLHCVYFLCGGAGFATGLAMYQGAIWARRFSAENASLEPPVEKARECRAGADSPGMSERAVEAAAATASSRPTIPPRG